MIRLLAVLLVWLVAGIAAAQEKNPILILIQPHAAGPEAPPDSYVHEGWVQWPPVDGSTDNRLLSIVTGVDWRGDPQDFRFTHIGGGAWRAGNAEAMRRRGHFAAKRAALPGGTAAIQLGAATSDRVRLLAVGEEGVVTPIPAKEAWPPGTLLIAEARTWDEVAALRDDTRAGRVLVVEYPPQKESFWSRLWLEGRDWPPVERASVGRRRGRDTKVYLPAYKQTGQVPGLVPARELGRLVAGVREPTWLASAGPTWSGPDRWLRLVTKAGPWVRGTMGLLAVGLVVWGLRLVADERRSLLYALAVVGYGLLIPAVVIAGNLARLGGVGGWATWLPIGLLAVAGIAHGVRALSRRFLPAVHKLWPAALTVTLLLLASVPLYSFLSGQFAKLPRTIPPEPLGLLVAAVTILVAGARGEAAARAAAAGLALGAAILGWLASAWWGQGHFIPSMLPALVWLAANGRLRIWMAFAGWLFTDGMAALRGHGVVYRAAGLVSNLPERDAYDLSPIARFFASPAFLSGAFVAVACVLFIPPFAARQLRRVWAGSSLVRPLASLAGATAILGLFQPPLLDASFVVAVAAVLVLLVEAAWTSPELS